MEKYKEAFILLFHIIYGRYLSLKKISNFVLSAIGPFTRNHISSGYPPVYAIDLSSSCNISCYVCPAGKLNQKTPNKNMSPDHYKKMIDEIQDRTLAVFFYPIGEPFMNKAAYEMIDYAHQRNIFTIASTNAQLINTEKKAEKLVNTGLNHLIVSISGITQETHSKYHILGDINQVFSNVKKISTAKKQLGSNTPHITLRFIRFTYNKKDIGKLKKIKNELGINSISVRDARVNMTGNDLPNVNGKNFLDYLNNCVSKKDEMVSPRKSCYWPWLIGVITWDGSVAPCCQYPWIQSKESKNYFGNVFEAASFKEVWQGQRLQKLRLSLLTGNGKPSFCRACVRNIGFGDKV